MWSSRIPRGVQSLIFRPEHQSHTPRKVRFIGRFCSIQMELIARKTLRLKPILNLLSRCFYDRGPKKAT